MNTSQAAPHARQQAAARLPSRPPRQGKPSRVVQHDRTTGPADARDEESTARVMPRGRACSSGPRILATHRLTDATERPFRSGAGSRAGDQDAAPIDPICAPDPIGTEGPMAAPIGGSGAGQTGTCAGERGGIALAARCLTRQPPGSNPVARPAAAVHGRACPAGGYVGLRPGEPADYRFPRPVGQPADQQALRRTAPEPQAPGDPAPAAGRSARRHRPATRPRRSARSVAPGRRCRSQTNLRIRRLFARLPPER